MSLRFLYKIQARMPDQPPDDPDVLAGLMQRLKKFILDEKENDNGEEAPLCRTNYVDPWQSLLDVEHAHCKREMRKHDMKAATLGLVELPVDKDHDDAEDDGQKYETFVALEVPGLASGQPNLIVGGHVEVSENVGF